MAQLTLAQVLGPNATQTATEIVISKADLADVGLTAVADNNGEQIYTALILKGAKVLTPENQTSNSDQSIVVEEGFPSIVQRNNNNYRQNQLTVSFQKADTQASIDPDDY